MSLLLEIVQWIPVLLRIKAKVLTVSVKPGVMCPPLTPSLSPSTQHSLPWYPQWLSHYSSYTMHIFSSQGLFACTDLSSSSYPNFLSFSSVLICHLINEAHSDHTIKIATCTQPLSHIPYATFSTFLFSEHFPTDTHIHTYICAFTCTHFPPVHAYMHTFLPMYKLTHTSVHSFHLCIHVCTCTPACLLVYLSVACLPH